MKQEKAIALLNERCKLENRYFQLYEEYAPNYKKPRITSKFYAWHEADTIHVDPERIRKLVYNTITPPKFKRDWPESENHWYGWFLAPLTDLDRTDPRIYFPSSSTEISRIGCKFLAEQIKTKKKK